MSKKSKSEHGEKHSHSHSFQITHGKPAEEKQLAKREDDTLASGIITETGEVVKSSEIETKVVNKVAEPSEKKPEPVKPHDDGHHSARKYKVLDDIQFPMRGSMITWHKGDVRTIDLDTARRAREAGVKLEEV